MIDFARITVTAGSGGNGGSSQRQIKGKRYSKADGGNGGNGGNVEFEASSDVNTLEKYRYVKDYKAEDGKPGLGNQRRGATAPDLVLKVPTGTLITIQNAQDLGGSSGKVPDSAQLTFTKSELLTRSSSASTGGRETADRTQIFDLIAAGQRVLIARSGIGGRGNAHLRDEFGRRPYKGEKGTIGETVNATLELKLIAQVGLIGLPNAGKSTLLAALTAAHPQIADYPFTTLEPNLGVLRVSVNQNVSESVSRKASEPVSQNSESPKHQNTDSPNHRNTDTLILADIPGLIEGASEGRGLGHQFLRHIERTKLLVHLIDISASQWVSESVSRKAGEPVSQNSESPIHRITDTPNHQYTDTLNNIWTAYQTVRNELKSYSKELAKKKEIVLLTKIDLVPKETTGEVIKMFKGKKKKVFAISAQTGQGLKELIQELTKH